MTTYRPHRPGSRNGTGWNAWNAAPEQMLDQPVYVPVQYTEAERGEGERMWDTYMR